MTISYMIYQAERPVTRSEQLAADAARGELARTVSSLLRGRRGRRAAGDGHSPATEVPCYPPAEWMTSGAR
jgi:hypothetical protein